VSAAGFPDMAHLAPLMLDAIGQAVITTDLDNIVIYWNAAAESLYGWSAEEAVGRPASELTVSDMDQEQADAIMTALSQGAEFRGEFRAQRRDGTTFPALVVDTGVYSEDGQLVGIVGVCTDLTGPRKAEQAQHDTEQRLRTVVENSPVVLAAFDESGTLTMLEGQCLVRLGLEGADYVGLPFVRLAESVPEVAAAIRSALQGETSEATSSFQGRQFEYRYEPERDASGRVVGVVGIGVDVTERLRAASDQAEREARWQSLVSLSADVAAVADAETTELTYVSPAVTRLFGWQPDQLLGKLGRSLVHPEDADLVGRAILEVRADPGHDATVEFRLACADGSYRWVEETISNRADVPGVHALVGNIRDISERRTTQEALRRSEARYRLIAETAQEGIWATDPDGWTLYANQKMAELVGHPLSELYARQSFELTGAEVRQDLRDRTWTRLERGAEQYEFEHVTPNGARRVLRVSASPLIEDGVHVGSLAMVSDVTEARAAAEALRHRAMHDPLTDLPNRVLLLQRLQEFLDRAGADGADAGQPQPVAVLVADVDQFKLINDSFGHAAGDELLLQITRRWRGALRSQDTLGRLGGDEFVILCDGIDAPDAPDVAERLLRALDEPIEFNGVAVNISTSIGIAVTGGTEETSAGDAAALLRYADAAMYEAKAQGRSRAVLYDARLTQQARRRLELLNELKTALERDELTLYYQPVVDLKTGRLLGVEALCRWPHLEKGFVPPSEFVAVAEQSGLVDELDRWVLRRACRDGAELRDEGVLPADAYIAVNVSAGHLGEPGFESEVRATLEGSGMPPQALVLEVTESAVMHDPDVAQAVLERLQELGVRVAIDDFGTGYSSLAYLRRFPVATLKIDRSFVENLTERADDRAIVTAVIDLAHALNVATTAEGIETESDLELLQDLGCNAGQGYLWSPAVPPGHLAALLTNLPGGRFVVRSEDSATSWPAFVAPAPRDAVEDRSSRPAEPDCPAVPPVG
jgi:diguanylate cyclase (GGDEF)-like protein/PAS domain S-box-containing protein